MRNAGCCSVCHQTLPTQFCQPSSRYRNTEHQMTILDMGRIWCDKSSCKINRDVNELREAFWGPQHDEAIRTKEKGQRLEEIMRKFYNGPKDIFEYKVRDVKVCDKGFFLLLGLIIQSYQKIGEQLRHVMNTIRHVHQKKPQVDDAAKEFKRNNDPRSRCSEHAVCLITLNWTWTDLIFIF